MWWVIAVIFLVGLLMSGIMFVMQYYGFCPMNPNIPGYWTYTVSPRVPPKKEDAGLSEEVVNRLVSYHNVNDIPHQAEVVDSLTQDGECLICQEEMQSAKISQLPCGHIYHKACVSNWLNRKATCPSCRTTITEENINGIPEVPLAAPDIEMGMTKSVSTAA